MIDASPLILLSRAGHLELLQVVAREIIVPAPVAVEIRAKGTSDPTAEALNSTYWLRIEHLTSIPDDIAAWDLGPGESSAIALAHLHNRIAIIDDLAGRKCAVNFGISVRGTLGIVLLAKQEGLISSARSVLEELLANGMYLTSEIINHALTKVGE